MTWWLPGTCPPRNARNVLTYCTDGVHRIDAYTDGHWHEAYAWGDVWAVAYWTELPEPPKGA